MRVRLVLVLDEVKGKVKEVGDRSVQLVHIVTITELGILTVTVGLFAEPY